MREKNNSINVAVIGNTGEGKSTLINAVLGVSVSKTDVGRPVTQDVFLYKVPRTKLCLFDTKGFEVEASVSTVSSVRQLIQTRSREADVGKMIHCLWLCVSAQSHRWQEVQRDFVQLSTSLGVPCIVVVTQSYGDDEKYVEIIQHNVPKKVVVIPVLAKSLGLPNGSKIPAFGIPKLVKTTTNLGNSFRSQAKREKALIKGKRLVKKTIFGFIALIFLTLSLTFLTGAVGDLSARAKMKCQPPVLFCRFSEACRPKLRAYNRCIDRKEKLGWSSFYGFSASTISLSVSVFLIWYGFFRPK